MNFTVPRADRAHQYLIFRLSNCGEPVVEQAGRDLETLRRLRNRADYDEAPPLSQPQAAGAVRLAEGIIRELDLRRPTADSHPDPKRPDRLRARRAQRRDLAPVSGWPAMTA